MSTDDTPNTPDTSSEPQPPFLLYQQLQGVPMTPEHEKDWNDLVREGTPG